MTLQDVRNEFPALERQTFLDSACVSLAPQRAVHKLRSFLDMAASCPSGSLTQHHLDMDEMDEDIALANFLQQHKVLVSVRYTSHVGGVRVSCHLFNNQEDLDRLLELVAIYLCQHAKATV
jgi:selenocysteine lyase/cysteine desulfurase